MAQFGVQRGQDFEYQGLRRAKWMAAVRMDTHVLTATRSPPVMRLWDFLERGPV
jgi:hypothetical protein